MDLEISHIATRHFELPMFPHEQGTTAKSTDGGGDYSVQAVFRRDPFKD